MRFIALILSLATTVAFATQPAPPAAPVRPVVTDYYGTKVTDNYRYFENLKDPAVQSWLKAQAGYTRDVLNRLPGRDALLQRIHALDSHGPMPVSSVKVVGRRIYGLRLPTDAQMPRLYVRDGLSGHDRLLIDPARHVTTKGVPVAINGYWPSPDGRYVAYTLAAGGSEERVLHVLDTATGKDLPGALDRFGFADAQWLADGKAFFYSRFKQLKPGMPATEKFNDARVYLHRLGTPYARDVAVAGTDVSPASMHVAPGDMPFLILAPGSRHAVLAFNRGVDPQWRVFTAPVESILAGKAQWRTIAGEYGAGLVADLDNNPASLHGDTLYWISRAHSNKGEIMKLNLARADSRPQVAVAAEALPINGIVAATHALYWRLNNAGINSLWRKGYATDATARRLALPFAGDVANVVADGDSDMVLLREYSWTRIPTWLAVDAKTGVVSDPGLQPRGANDRDDSLVVEEVKVRSWDGALVPLSIVRRKDVPLDGSAPLMLRGYGAYGRSISPTYIPFLGAVYEHGSINAVCHVRGGGEYGEAWHRGGYKATKPNTWKDFIACAEYLIAHKYTSKAELGGMGGSAGGILIGRAIEARPDLFAVAIANVPSADMLRFETTPGGPANVKEFGSVKTEAGFRALYAMSPYAHVEDGVRYPAVMVTTGVNDPRVTTWIPAKFAARLQAATRSGKPVLLRVDYAAGHGIGSSKAQMEAELADQLAFFLWQTGQPDFQPQAGLH
ncbi:MAG TPA: prolyl oligopeptidase family serine peptidase [Oleiagrimonas sp.]|nr:prolyl oligopeptidase family serine peptidase [Oleiagrimonas sp.]